MRGRLWVALAGALVALLAGAAPAGADPALPYTDSAATGRLTLCGSASQPVRSGDVRTAPFVRRAVGGSAAPAPYDGEGRTATLYAFQPRPGVPASGWSGQMLTSSTRYDDPARPLAAGDTR